MFEYLIGILVVLIFILVWKHLAEKMRIGGMVEKKRPDVYEGVDGNERSVSMMDFENEDPKLSKYTTRFRDVMGMGGDDYFFEHETLYKSGVESQRHGVDAFEADFGYPGQRGFGYRLFSNGDIENPFQLVDIPIGPSLMGSVESAEPLTGGSEDIDNSKEYGF